jgi:hypothetical protein
MNIYGFGPNSPMNGFDDFGLGWWSGIPVIGPAIDFLTGAPALQNKVNKWGHCSRIHKSCPSAILLMHS